MKISKSETLNPKQIPKFQTSNPKQNHYDLEECLEIVIWDLDIV